MMITLGAFSGLKCIRHAFFTRRGGVSEGLYASLNCGPGSKDDLDKVKANRATAMTASGFAGAELLTARQIHSSTVITIDKPWNTDMPPPQADGLVSNVPGMVIGVLSADCAPVLFADHKARIVGAAHAGWRGAKAGILEATVKAMINSGAKATNIIAGIGPCIGPASYETGKEFRAQFIKDSADNQVYFSRSIKENHYFFNLPGYIAGRLEKLELMSIEDVSRDTFADNERFFSYRRATLNGDNDYGRQLSAIALAL